MNRVADYRINQSANQFAGPDEYRLERDSEDTNQAEDADGGSLAACTSAR